MMAPATAQLYDFARAYHGLASRIRRPGFKLDDYDHAERRELAKAIARTLFRVLLTIDTE